MERIPFKVGAVPPRGHVLGVDEKGNRFWFRVEDVSHGPKRHALTERQLARLKAFKAIVGAHDPATIEETIANFERDRYPDAELAIWERIAETYRAEVEERATTTERERTLIYRAALQCSLTTGSVDDLLAVQPELKGLENLARVVDRFRRFVSPIQRAGKQLGEIASGVLGPFASVVPVAVSRSFGDAFFAFRDSVGSGDNVIETFRAFVAAVPDERAREQLQALLPRVESLVREIARLRRE